MADDAKHLLTDIGIKVHHRSLRPVYRSDDAIKKIKGRNGWWLDFNTVSGRDNLEQAIIMRLLTPMGELSHFGHTQYGSRLHEMVGRTNTETTRNLVRLRILESLKFETRIEKVETVNVKAVPFQRSTIDIDLVVLPVGQTETISIGSLQLNLGN